MKNLYLFVVLLIGVSPFAKAQSVSQYYFKGSTGATMENMISGATPLLGVNADGVQSAPAEFFPFSFAGNSYHTFSVSDDGVVVLGNGVYAPYPYDNYFAQSYAYPPQTIAPVYPILLPWGEDLYTGDDGGVSYKITGTAPARKLVIDFKVRSVEDNTGSYNKNFQVCLFEGTNKIQFIYGNVPSSWYTSANIGVAASAADFMSVEAASNTVSTTVATDNGGQLPVNTTSYVFSPTEIKDEVQPDPTPVPTTPVAATVALSPEYPVAGQQKNTIYLGYGTQSVTLTATASGGDAASGYTYSWSPAAGLSSTNIAAPVASPLITTTYTVVVKDGKGNSTTKTVTVNVIDPRYGDKFRVCKLGKTTICISKEAVSAQLSNGATLGACGTTTTGAMLSANLGEANFTQANTNAGAVYPSPSSGIFYVQLPAADGKTTVTVYDAAGTVVAQQTAGETQQVVQFNLAHRAAGVYLVKMSSKNGVRTGKLVIR